MITPIGSWNKTRYSEFLDATKNEPRQKVLDLGSFDGQLTACLCETYNHVVSIEGRPHNFRRTKHKLINNKKTNWTLIEADVTKFDFSTIGTFNLVFNSGIMYHLAEPWTILTLLKPIAKTMWVCTHVAENSSVNVNGYDGCWYKENPKDSMGGITSNSSFWPTEKALLKMFEETGWTNITKIRDTRGNIDRAEKFCNFRRIQYLCK